MLICVLTHNIMYFASVVRKMHTAEPTIELGTNKAKIPSNLIVLSHDLKVILASLLLFTELPGSLKKSFSLGRTVFWCLHCLTVVSVGRF